MVSQLRRAYALKHIARHVLVLSALYGMMIVEDAEVIPTPAPSSQLATTVQK